MKVFHSTMGAGLGLALLMQMTAVAGAQNYEYSSVYQPNLSQINVTRALHAAHKAYIARSSAAKKVGVAILDGRVDVKHPDLKGVASFSRVYRGSYRYGDDHGTHVAGIVGAKQNSRGVVGVAPTVKLFSIPVFDDNDWVASDLGRAALNKAVKVGAKVANMSYGPGGDGQEGNVFISGELDIFDDYRSSMVLVRAAGNDGYDAWDESYRFDASEMLGHVLIVGSVDDDNVISDFSNRPGTACIGSAGCDASDLMKNFFMVAPGEYIASDVPGGYAYMSGTSMAAPHVSGAAALVFQRAIAGRQVLTPTQVAGILKQSAFDLGDEGVDEIYGWGLLDVAAALNPVGGTYVATQASVKNGLVSTKKSRLSRSSVLGTSRGFERAMDGMVVFDSFQRAFVISNPTLAEADSTLVADAVSGLQSSLAFKATAIGQYGSQKLTMYEVGSTSSGVSVLAFSGEDHQITVGLDTAKAYFEQADATADAPYSSTLGAHYFMGSGDAGASLANAMFAGGDYKLAPGLMVSALYLHGEGVPDADGSDDVGAGLLSFGSRVSVTDTVSLGISYGLLHEQGQMLGVENAGAYALGDVSITHLGGIHLLAALDERTRVSAFAEASLTSAYGTGDSMFSAPSDLRGSRMGVSLSRSGVLQAGDVVTASVIRPWRIDAGEIDARVATGREFDGSVIYETRTSSLGNGELPLDLGLSYTKTRGAFGYGASVWLRDDDARSFNPDEVSVAAAMSWNF